MEGRQQDLEESLLLILYEESELTSRRLKADEIARKFTDRVSEHRVAAGLQHLQSRNLVFGSFDNYAASGFAITRTGILYVEEHYIRIDEEENTRWHRKPELALGEYEPDSSSNSNVAQQADIIRQESGSAIHIHNVFSPNNTVTVAPGGKTAGEKSASRAGWFGAWGTWAGSAIALAALAWALHQAKVF